jgi:hypothetical protein
LQAQHVNQALGGAFVKPDELDELSDEFLDACNALTVELARMRAEMRKR